MCRSRAEAGTAAMRTGLMLLALASAFPATAAAQHASVVRALADLHRALDGTYGDEGSEVSRRLAEMSDAAAGWERSIREAEQNESSPVRQAFVLEAGGSAERSAAAFRHAWTLDPDNPTTAYLAITRAAIDDADRARARDTLMHAVRAAIAGARPQPSPFPESPWATSESDAVLFPPARYADGFARAMKGDLTGAAVRLREAAASDPLIADPAARSGDLLGGAEALRRGTLRAALAAFERAVAASPQSSEAHRMLATAAGIAGDRQTSVEHFEAALRIRPDDERSWMAFADMHAEDGRISDAVGTLEKAVAAIPESGALRWRLAGLLVRLERAEEALAQFTEAERLTPMSGRAIVHQAVATSASLQLDVARALAAAVQRVRADLNDAGAHRDLASLYLKEGRQEEAFAELAIAAWLDPDDPLTFVTLGHGLMADRHDDEAVAALERAVSLQPDLRDARYALAQALTRASRRAEAERHLAEFERQRAEAVAREQKALELAALKSEAATKSAAGQHGEALALWKQVIALEPESARNYLDIAEALVRAGALDESLPFFVKTTELDGVADVHRRLAEVLARLGRTTESGLARDTYESLRLEDFRRRSHR